MEFFTTANLSTTTDSLQEKLSLNQLDRYCSEINKVLYVESEQRGSIYCTWGEFIVERQLIHGGLRFTLPQCPNALSWTITCGAKSASDQVVIHATINRTTHDSDFIESIETFVDGWKSGLETMGETNTPDHNG